MRGPAGIGKTALLAAARQHAAAPVYSAIGSELERTFPFGAVQQLLGAVPAEPTQAVLHELYWLVADRCPAVLLVDDAHWVDGASLRWLAYMVNRVADLPLAILLAARDGEPDELLARIALHSATTVLEPRPLSEAAVAELGGDAAVFEATGGNPFYVHAVLAGTPRSVVESVALRLAALPPACTALARALSVANGTVAARVAGLDVASAVTAFEALTRADIVRGDDFAHPLVREAVYAAIGADEKRRLHLAAARLLDDPERVAAQLMAAGPGGGVWAVEALRAAARAAWARGAPDVAAAFLDRASEEEMPRAHLVGLLRELARARVASAGPDGLPVLRQALALAEGDERTDIALELGRSLFSQGYFADACAAFEAGGAEAELATVAVLDLSLVRRFGGLDAIAARAPGTAVAAWIEVARSPDTDGAQHAEAALADPDIEPSDLAAGLMALMAAGRLDEAEARWSAVAESARAAGALDTLRLAVALRALVRLRLGRVAETEADLRELIDWVAELQLPLASYRTALPFVVAPLIDALVERGELEEAGRWPALTGLEAGWPEEFGFTFLIDSLARLRLAQGRAHDGLHLARECARRQRAWGIRNPGFVAYGSTLAAALAATGRTSEALDACDEQIDLARRFGAAREEGMALTALGRITGDPEPLRAAVTVLEHAPLERAHALVALGGREPLREALDLAERCGATALADTARDALVATGARPRRAQLTGAAALTPAQRRIAQLAAEGLGNRAIAERLFLTEKTVEGHLSAVYRKLGITSRSQLRTDHLRAT